MSPAATRGRRRLRVWLASALGGVAIRAIALTWRYRVHGGQEFEQCVREGKPASFVLWHGEMLPLILWWKGRGIRALISTHSDGEIIARIVEGLGYRTARGSSSREGTRALRELIGALRDGEQIAVTPDGPRGPRHSFALGVVHAAARTQTPVIVARALASRAWVLRSWDRFVIPKFFARVDLYHSPLVQVSADSSDDVTAEADRLAGMLRALAPDPFGTT